MTAVVQPPRLTIGPFAWLRKNLFSTWYNVVLTFVALWLLYSLLRPAIQWALAEARWGVIEANLTLFMIGQYPRDQLWRVWLGIYLLGGMIGLSWGVWRRGRARLCLHRTWGRSWVCLDWAPAEIRCLD